MRISKRVTLALVLLAAAGVVAWVLGSRPPDVTRGSEASRGAPRDDAPPRPTDAGPLRLEGPSRDAPSGGGARPPPAPDAPRRLVLVLRSEVVDLARSFPTVHLSSDEGGGVSVVLDARGVMEGTATGSPGVTVEASAGKVRRVVFDGLPASRYAVHARNGDAARGFVDVDLLGSASEERTVVLVGPESEPLLRVVATRGGSPVPGVGVRVKLRKGLDWGFAYGDTDAKGEASFRVPPRRWWVDVKRYPGSTYLGLPAEAEVEVETAHALEARVRFELPVAPEVSFRVLDAEGRPLAFGLQLWRVGSDRSLEFWNTAGQVRPDGEAKSLLYRGLLPAGDYVAWASPHGPLLPATTRFSVLPDDVSRDVTLRATESGVTPRFVVSGADGKPVASLRFNLNQIRATPEQSAASFATTDADGKAVASGELRPGPCDVMIWDRGLSRRVEIADDSEIRLVLPPTEGRTATCVLKVRTDSGESIDPVVFFHPSSGDWSRFGRRESDGFVREALDPGSWVIHVPWHIWYEGIPRFRDFRRPIVLRAGETEELEIALSR